MRPTGAEQPRNASDRVPMTTDPTPMDTFDFHHSMLTDRVRVEAFTRAVLAAVGPGDVVLDLGSGTGLLAMIAARAGARRVYAIESGPVIHVARRITERNGLADRIVFVPGASTEVELPEPADVVVSETIGNAAFDEGIAAWLLDARRRFLRPGGTVVPGLVELLAAPVHLPNEHAAIARWREPLLGMDFGALGEVAGGNLQWVELSPASLVGSPQPIITCDVGTWDGRTPLRGCVRTAAVKASPIHGIGLWFRSTLVPGITLTTEPPNAAPSWQHGLLPLAEPLHVVAGDALEISVGVDPEGRQWEWDVSMGA